MNYKINGIEYKNEKNQTIQEAIENINKAKEYIAAIVNGRVVDLKEPIFDNDQIELISKYSNIGNKIYSTSLSMLLIIAVKEVLGDLKVNVEYSIGDGIYISIDNYKITREETFLIDKKMRELQTLAIEINKERVSKNVAISIFKAEGYIEKVALIESLNLDYVDIYLVNGRAFSFDKALVADTSFVDKFRLIPYYPGIVIQYPNKECKNLPKFEEQVSLSKIYSTSKKWTDLMGIKYAADLNRAVLDGKMDKLILVNETYYNNQLALCAKDIIEKNMQIVLIAGPSSSGKSTTAEKLAIQLAVYGKNTFIISTDDYFIDRDKTPINEYGHKDYENVKAIDLERLNEDLLELLEGKEIELPSFNFISGKREKSNKKIKLDEGILIIEGIHSLNPILSKYIPQKNKYKIYVSALTQINIDSHNRISSSDARLIRRIVRDKNFRGYNPIETIEAWDNVRRGEREYIFPFQENADFYMDTSLIYEFNALKNEAIKALDTIDKTSKYYYKANDLKKLLSHFIGLDDLSIITNDSILREFIGD
ncbi:MAG: nucleoside kinase [Peptoniphilaceae bacterium]|nr:nucleoside kinase [Peptoniphilaceae bacterium]MDY6018663.1 nucleoside kinase [Anaerococcus sp.]